MSSSNFPADPGPPFVTDASVVINLNATASAAAIIGAFPNPFVVTEAVRRELSRGQAQGHRCGERLETLISQGLIHVVELLPDDEPIYRSLVDDDVKATLDDGEAATIAHAVGCDGVALIDERKARRICAVRFPSLRLVPTIDVLLHPNVTERLGESGQSEAIYLALRHAKMHVPRHRHQMVVERIGPDRAAECTSLPRSFRT